MTDEVFLIDELNLRAYLKLIGKTETEIEVIVSDMKQPTLGEK